MSGSAPAVIVGASHAGVQTAIALRQSGWQEPIVLFSAEDALPYHRPPLSKAFLAGEKSAEQIVLRAARSYSDLEIELRLGEPVLTVDARKGEVSSAKERRSFSKLVLATGSRARRLAAPGHALNGIFTLRDLADARRLMSALAEAENIVIVGGGFIGLEFAATAAKFGKTITVVETQNHLLARALPPTIGSFLGAVHRSRGVRFIHGIEVRSFDGDMGRVTAAQLSDGSRIAADLVLVGIGGEADLALARTLGLSIEAGGVLVDGHGRTSAPSIYGVGDVASFHNAFALGPMRLESVQNASDQAKAAAAHIAGADAPSPAVPWFWTDQYEFKIQIAGLPTPGCTEILRGDPESGSFSLLQFRGNRLVAAHSVNRAGDHISARKLIAAGACLDLALAEDIDVPLANTSARVPAGA